MSRAEINARERRTESAGFRGCSPCARLRGMIMGSIQRRYYIGVLVAVVAAGAVAAALAWKVRAVPTDVKASPSRPNVLLISLDTTRADHLGCYGYTRPTTPNLDRLAARG